MMGDFWTLAAGAFVGSFAAFCFNRYLQQKKQREENLTYLRFSISRLVAFTNNLYLFKDKFVKPRTDAVEELERPKGSSKKHGTDNRENGQSTLQERMHNGQYDWPFSIEKLGFIAEQDPKIIRLISKGSYAVETLKNVVISVNDLIDAQEKNGNKASASIYFPLIKKLGEQVDTALYLAEKSIERLIKSREDIFETDMKVGDAALIDPQYQALKPKPPERLKKWENTNWNPPQQKKCCCAALMDIFRC